MSTVTESAFVSKSEYRLNVIIQHAYIGVKVHRGQIIRHVTSEHSSNSDDRRRM